MTLRLSLSDVRKLGKAAVAQLKPAIAFSIETWRDIETRINLRLKPEELAQRAIMNWCRANLPPGWIAFHIPSEASRSRATWAMLRILGFFAGFPDILIIAPGGQCCLIEVKRADEKPRLSPAQKAFRAWAETFKVPYLVAQTSEDLQGWLTFPESDS